MQGPIFSSIPAWRRRRPLCFRFLLLHQFNRELFMRRINVARQGRNRKTGCRLSRISDAVLRRLDKQKSSSINWWSSNDANDARIAVGVAAPKGENTYSRMNTKQRRCANERPPCHDKGRSPRAVKQYRSFLLRPPFRQKRIKRDPVDCHQNKEISGALPGSAVLTDDSINRKRTNSPWPL